MKKFIALLLALALIFTLAACSPKKTAEKAMEDALSDAIRDAASGKLPTGSGGADPDHEYTQEEIDDALEQLEKWALAQGWTESDYGNSIYGVWDSDVLPDCVPKEIPGVKTDETTYKEKHHEKSYNNEHELGRINFESKDYEEWGVDFNATKAQFDTFISELEKNGFYGGQTSDSQYNIEYSFLGNGYYAYIYLIEVDDGEFDYWVYFSMVKDDINPYPKSFNGTKLPTVGVVSWIEGEYFGYGWDDALDEEVEGFWDPYKDTGKLPNGGWSLWYEYYVVSEAQVKEYVKSMESQGWTIEYEDQYYEDYGYTYHMKKGDMVASVDYELNGKYSMSVGFGSSSDYLWY
jgi:hypothetical protein